MAGGQARQLGQHGIAELVAVEREGDVGEHEPGLVAAVVPCSFAADAVERHFADQCRECVGQLNFAATSRF